MKQLVVLSGKGGTGKTTLVGSLASLMPPDKVVVDCDVDAADLHLMLHPVDSKSRPFRSGVKATIAAERCTACGTCASLCQFAAIRPGEASYGVDPLSCEGCGVCAHFCPEGAIHLEEQVCGTWSLSQTAYGPLVHAQLGVGAENSGRLVSLVKREAVALAEARNASWILIDGPPGIGCPVIASLSGADCVVLVSEPSQSGLHDLERVTKLTRHFDLPTCVCVNKWDLSPEMTLTMEKICADKAIPVLGRIPFDPQVVSSLVAGVPLVEYTEGSAADAVRTIWRRLPAILKGLGPKPLKRAEE